MDAQTIGAKDDAHFAYARQNNLILVTKNPSDFIELHHKATEHAGLFVTYQDNLPSDMKAPDIVRAIANIAKADIPIDGQVFSLNDWKY
jgi:predicted nuclease of predicted toxin-antitoxin system